MTGFEMPRDFKGVWIPKEIWLDERLTALDKVILVEILSLDHPETGCYASNEYIADFCQCSKTKVATSIAKLKNIGYIYEKEFNGRVRVLKGRLSKSERQTFKKCKADFQKVYQSNIESNIDNNITSNIYTGGEKISPTVYEEEFDDVWQLYPNKKGKENSKKAYIKARKSGVEKDTIIQGIERYKEQIKRKNTEAQYIKHGSTWFNQKCWEDEYDNNGGNSRTNGTYGNSNGDEREDAWFYDNR